MRTGSVCHRHEREDETTLFQLDDPDEVRAMLPLLRVDEHTSGSSCMCCGRLTLEFYREQTLLAEMDLHHGKSLRWRGWPGDGALDRPAHLCAWLARLGVRAPCGEPDDSEH